MTENNIFEPLILSGGSHDKTSGRGCAMNVVSWMHGDEHITDYPTCSNDSLARLVQILNDSYSHKAATRRARERQDREGSMAPLYHPDDYALDPKDAEVVIALGTATIGTGTDTLTPEETQKGLRAVRKVMAEAIGGYEVQNLETGLNEVAYELGLSMGDEKYNEAMAPLVAEAINAFKLAVAKPVVMPTRADVQVAYEKMVAAKA